jgi:hypothetical protein
MAPRIQGTGIESLHRLDQPQAAFLAEVLEAVAAALGFLACHPPHQRQVGVDQRIAIGGAAAVLVGRHQGSVALAEVGAGLEGVHRAWCGCVFSRSFAAA